MLAAGAAYLWSSAQPRQYESEATLIVGGSLTNPNQDYNQLLASQRLTKTYASIATTRPMLQGVIDTLGLPVTPEELAKHVVVTAPIDSTLIVIEATDPDPVQAAAIANTLADGLVAAAPGLQGEEADIRSSIQRDLAATQLSIDAAQAEVDRLNSLLAPTAEESAELEILQSRIVSLRQTSASLLSFLSDSAANTLTVVESAVPTADPVSPRPLLNIALAMFLAILLVTTAIFGYEYLDGRIRTQEDVREAIGLPTVGAIPVIPKAPGASTVDALVSQRAPHSTAAESFRTLKTNVEHASFGAPVRTLLVTSAESGAGATVTAANLATVFARGGERVVIVDANLRRPGLDAIFGVVNLRGLSDELRTPTPGPDLGLIATGVPNLRILTTGASTNPVEVLSPQRLQSLLERIHAVSDLVIVDGPPLHEVADGTMLSQYVDATLLVIQPGGDRDILRQSIDALGSGNGRVIGVVLNRIADAPTSTYAVDVHDPFRAGSYTADPSTASTGKHARSS